MAKRKKPICRHLRTKTSYVPADRSSDYLAESSANAQYWCIHTMRGVGPDDRFVSPEDCITGRGCFHAIGRALKDIDS